MSGVVDKFADFLGRHLWWMAPVVIIMPLVYFSDNAVAPSAAYFGTTGIWNVASKIFDQI
jgi:hypothetical protein